jgi:hypothetical protein
VVQHFSGFFPELKEKEAMIIEVRGGVHVETTQDKQRPSDLRALVVAVGCR